MLEKGVVSDVGKVPALDNATDHYVCLWRSNS